MKTFKIGDKVRFKEIDNVYGIVDEMKDNYHISIKLIEPIKKIEANINKFELVDPEYSDVLAHYNKIRDAAHEFLKDLEWYDMETKECHCYSCELFDRKNNKCKDITLCKNPKRTYKGFYVK